MMNTIKKFISMALSVSMVAASFTSTYAASSNSITRIDSVKEDDVVKNVELKIRPTSAVESGSSIILTLENAEFDEEVIEEKTGKTLADTMTYSATADNIKPFEFKKINDKEAQIFLGGVAEAETDFDPKPYYLIPIVAKATSDEDIKVSIDANGTSISATTHTVATSTSTDGSTKTTVNKTKTFSDILYVDTITVKEDTYDTFKTGEVKVRVNGGFRIIDDGGIKVSAGVNLDNNESPEVKVADGGQYFTFVIPESWTGTEKASSFNITGVKIEAEDDDKNYGEVKLTISGGSAKISKETISVGTRQDFGFEFQTLTDITTIVSGRNFVDNRNLDRDDFKSAKIKFAELTADTWMTNRKLEFTVPEGVKIVGADFKTIKHITGLEDAVSIANKGTSLKIDKGIEINSTKADDVASFEMELYFTVDADYVGDIDLSVKGAGLAEDEVPAITVAKAIAPIEIASETTEVNLGYQTFAAKDITITENQDGALLDGEKVVISFDDKQFGNSELGFNDADIDYAISGELEVKDFKVTSGEITFKVDRASYTEPASITISNITVGTTRSVPYGSYAIKVGGSAVINNYDKNVDDVYPVKLDKVDEKDNDDIYYFDTTDGYAFDDYIRIITAVGTFDSTVEVTVGTTVIKVNGEEYEIDAYSYIQPTTNSTLVPLRAVAVALADGDVTKADESSNIAWDAETKTVTIVYNGKIVQFQANSNYMVVDGTTIACDNGAVAEITDNRMYVPMRALGVALGVPVDWDAETRTAKYN